MAVTPDTIASRARPAYLRAMRTLHRYEVEPSIPAELARLGALAKNLWWSWNESARDLFARVDPELYERVSENPVALLFRTSQERLDTLAKDPGYLAELGRIDGELTAYLARETWFDRTYRGTPLASATIAYFSMEFGVHEAVPVYSGGLGVLAGDHLKSASDLGLPLVGVGVAFSQGYFRQSLDHEGWQTERYPPNDWHDLPVSPVNDAAGARVTVAVTLPAPGQGQARRVALQAWRVDVGRIPLYLLDANLGENAPEDRALTNTLYGGDKNHRIRQEILLGVGGVRLLEAIGVRPSVCHMNEGHSAFLALERVRQLMAREGAPFAVAAEAASAGNVFTTHTPVPAGNDAFAHDLITPYLSVLGEGTGLSTEEVRALGRADAGQAGAEFSMPVLAIRMADRYNGVSLLHGREARAMWQRLWPELGEHEVPIGSITNGVHLRTWVGRDLAALYNSVLGPDWSERGTDPAVWARIANVTDAELWALRQRARARLVTELPARLRHLTERKGLVFDPGTLPAPLDPNALTIGFARRFATYKRGTLLLRDGERLRRILSRAGQPVQLVFAGKAHPQDFGGKELIRDIVRASRSDAFRGRIVFVEDYDMSVARALVSGVDVWLNTPRRPLEASGTSGMKAAVNGVLNASVLDGWWAEAFTGDNGFGIGHGEEYADAEHGDRIEAEALYRLLESELCPLFYDRDEAGLPRGWIARMKRSIESVGAVFNTGRMVEEYTARLYDPAARRFAAMNADGLARARTHCAWKARIAAHWPAVRVEQVTDQAPRPIRSGHDVPITAEVQLGALGDGDVIVEAYYGPLHGHQAIAEGAAQRLRHAADLGGGRHRFEGSIPARASGEHAFAVRVLPHGEALPNPFAMRMLAWQ
jgi:starch phosphorylase